MSHVDATRTKRSRAGVIVRLALVVGVVVVVVVWILWRIDQDDHPATTTTPAGDRDAAAAADAVDALISASEREDCDTIVDLLPLATAVALVVDPAAALRHTNHPTGTTTA